MHSKYRHGEHNLAKAQTVHHNSEERHSSDFEHDMVLSGNATQQLSSEGIG